jgi:mono/diheme cytochrome c family protein
MNTTPLRRIAFTAMILTLSMASSAAVQAQEIFSGKYGQQTGEQIYQGLCQGCHMPDAKGATGAGTYPALANNPRLAASVYPITVVLNGQRAMPSFGHNNPPFAAGLTDVQIANVLNYVRTHFGNDYKDMVTVDAVKAARRQMLTRGTSETTDKAAASH